MISRDENERRSVPEKADSDRADVAFVKSVAPAPATSELPSKELEALWCIAMRVDDAGTAPTRRELGAALGLASHRRLDEILGALETKGFIRREAHVWGGIVVLVHPREARLAGGPRPGLAKARAASARRKVGT